jgi:hypothetical protein
MNNEIDVLCLQEIELISNLDHNLISLYDYLYESEINNKMSWGGMYIKSGVNYVR